MNESIEFTPEKYVLNFYKDGSISGKVQKVNEDVGNQISIRITAKAFKSINR
ncbi:hypothetical protein [Argonema antarcticum]|uniref:hypothetical protein n=1 Tax=Argonema antarcticum TaxID=2942763 RepID=UPI0020136557|nr:hypothetical protein [Argonema antarcticum]MCL1470468.1 hypothetical protein [Argonema antarcticum A004/B2]